MSLHRECFNYVYATLSLRRLKAAPQNVQFQMPSGSRFWPLKDDTKTTKVKFGLDEYTIGLLSYAKYSPDREEGGYESPQNSNLVVFAVIYTCSR